MLNIGFYDCSDFTFDEGNKMIHVKIKFNREHDIFKGHFPEIPVVPGVCMMQIMKETLENYLNREIFLSTAGEVKFIGMVNPDINPEVELDLVIKNSDENLINVNAIFYFREMIFTKVKACYKIL